MRQPVTLPLQPNGPAAPPPATSPSPRPVLDDLQVERLAGALETAGAAVAAALDRLTAAIRDNGRPVTITEAGLSEDHG